MDAIAKQVHELLAGLPNSSAQIVAGMLMSEGFADLTQDMDISKFYFDNKAEHVEELKTALVRSYISKRENGESVEIIRQMSEIIAKTGMGFTSEERSEAVKDQPRGDNGRFGFKNKGGTALHRDNGKRKSASQTLNDVAVAANRNFIQPRTGNSNTDMSFVPNVGRMQAVGDTASFLHATVGGYLPASATTALRAGALVGQYGPRAQQVFGPAIDRTKYRYRGVERKLDPELMTALSSDLGPKDKPPAQGRRTKLIYGDRSPSTRRVQATGSTGGSMRGGFDEWKPSETVAYIRDHWLPNEKLAALQRFSGHQPPSEGIIIDARGRVSAQMVGHGDDWYLPFDLKNLGPLKGGEYIRTRTHGGLTTEDVYTGLMTGARSMTVVSHNGVYTMEFDDALRGSRRYSSTAREMTERYGQILDAVKSGQVYYGDIDPSRMSELWDESGGDQNVFESKVRAERDDPKPSVAMVNDWSNSYLDRVAENYQTRDGRTLSREELISQVAVPKLADEIAFDTNQNIGGAVYTATDDAILDQAQAIAEMSPARVVGVLGPQYAKGYQNFIRDATGAYVESQQPMELNGEGYNYAMQALKEQFPYFVKKVNYEPWDRNRRSARGQDKGYVKARYNRSDDVKAGYFDSKILGFGKVPASRTRFQNSRVTGTVETGWRPGNSRNDLDRDAAAGGGSGDDTGSQGSGTQAVGTAGGEKLTHQEKKSRRRANDLELINHLLSQKTIGPRWNGGGYQWGSQNSPSLEKLRGSEIAGSKVGWMNSDDRYNPFTLDIEDFNNLSDEELHLQAKKMLTVAQDDKLFDLDDSESQRVISQYRADGGEAPKRKIDAISEKEILSPSLSVSEEDFEAGPDFRPGRAYTDYSKTYNYNTLVQTAVRAGKLPAINHPDLSDEATALIDETQANADDNDGKLTVHQIHVITGALLAKQLHRLYKKSGGPAPGRGNSGGIAPTQILPKLGPTGTRPYTNEPMMDLSQEAYSSGLLRPIMSMSRNVDPGRNTS